MNEPAIILDDVQKHSKQRSGLYSISGTIAGGQLVGLVGPCGAGKTTLLRLIAGLLRPDAGAISVFGRDTVKEADAAQAMIGYVPQRSGVHDRLTAIQNLELYAALHDIRGLAWQQRKAEIVDITGLAAAGDRVAGTLPAGMRQMLGVACALVGTPRLLLLDEPGAAVDPACRRDLLRLSSTLASQGTTVLWSTSNFDEAEGCSNVLLLHDGRLIGHGPPAHLAAHLAGRSHAIRATGSQRREVAARLRAMPEVSEVQVRATSVRFLTDEPASADEMKRFLKIGEAFPIAPRLEDGFIAAAPAHPRAVPPSLREPAKTNGMGPVVEARGLAKRFKNHAVVEDVDLTAAPGGIFGLIGPTGAGKTTILRMLAGLLSPTAGVVSIGGLDAKSSAVRPRLGYMPQGSALYGDLSVIQNLRFFAAACTMGRQHRRETVDRILAELDLEQHASARTDDLAAGAKRRLALAATLVQQPTILLLDEPTLGADPATCREIWCQIEAFAAGGATVLVASSVLAEAELCDRVLLIDRGRGVACDSPDKLKAPLLAHGRIAEPSIEEVFTALAEDQRRVEAP
ncbi:ABC transporter ATP-binding protein [Mycobacterium sp. KBS0706]|uniref:ATP-binding cassette domain-containing protein n=1 Tax=Mycobacterium sp. KBS0706 TaxID=2578109 RepID=UPI00110FDF9D|nr:ATP-binding cassette domain-containing protein [Mycobacterium sp. KBS0706]TSD84040.1 ABC transporter ATP-binding protein [Mycobacterium sp. KBS0706]